MKFNRLIAPVFAIAVGFGATGAIAGHHEGHSADMAKTTIVSVAADNGSFSTLLAALDAAALTATLESDGPFTVFAPTEEAFAALPPGALDNLLANPDQLTQVLKLHVVAGNVTAAEVVNLTSVTTVEGSSLPVDTTDGVRIGGAKVIVTDVAADNGVIHVIDAVILPQA